MNGSKPAYKFGSFHLDVDKRLLLRDGEPVALAPKALETLIALIENRDRVSTKDELLQGIWGDTVVEEGGLTRNISILRKTLGEKPDDHQYITTVPGRGYRFVADVYETTADAVEPVAPVPAVAEAARGVQGRRWSSPWLVLGGLAVLAVALAPVYLMRSPTIVGPGRPSITALAVLPLENLSGDPSQEYFADGMTEALIANLARVRALHVVSRTSVMHFKGAPRPLPQIARMLNVDAVLEGSVQRTGDRVRINVQLIHAPTDTHLWTRAYERTLTDVLALQAEVARAVAEEIQVQVRAEERARLASAGLVNPVAYQEYLLGQHYLWRLTEEDLSRAIDHFERSASVDPTYAATYAGLSHAWWWRGIWGSTTRKEVEQSARAAAAKALELGPSLPEAHVSSGRIKFGYEQDWTGAERDFKRALEIDPNNADAHFFSAMLCMALGCFTESVAHMKRVEELDPLSPTVQSSFGRVLYRARKFDEAIVHFNRAIELAPYSPAGAYHRLAEVYEELGRYAEALALLQKAERVENRSGSALATARIYARMGKLKDARVIVDASRGSDPYSLAMVYAALGKKDEAFRLLLRAVEESPQLLGYVNTDPKFDSLRSDPRWKEVLHRLNLPTDGDVRALVDSR
jgi:TolB-like protein/DNA-binding winged helix-turn-helix (wHTH) protein/Tfp pilus assembly protein PilF